MKWVYILLKVLYLHRFFVLNVGIVYLYHSFYQRVDEEEFGGLWELVKEGMMTSFALFLVSYCSTLQDKKYLCSCFL